MSDFIAKLIALLKAVVAAIFGGLREGAAEIAHDVRRVAGFTRWAAEGTARLVGRGLTGPAMVLDRTASAVGGLLGALVPRPAPTASQVAEDAIANDNRVGAPVAAQVPLGELVLAHNKASMDPSGRTGRDLQPLPREVAAWLAGLDTAQRCTLAFVKPGRVEEHVRAHDASALHGMLPAMPVLKAQLDQEIYEDALREKPQRDNRVEYERALEALTTPEGHARMRAFRI